MREIEMERPMASTSSWSVDPERSRIEFVLTRDGLEAMRGSIPEMTGTLVIDAEDATRSSAVLVAETSRAVLEYPVGKERPLSAVGPADRPKVRFASRVVQPAGEDRYRVFGTLAAGDVLRMATLYVKMGEREYDGMGVERLPLRAVTTLDLAEAGQLTRPSGWSGLPFDEIALLIETELVRTHSPVNAA